VPLAILPVFLIVGNNESPYTTYDIHCWHQVLGVDTLDYGILHEGSTSTLVERLLKVLAMLIPENAVTFPRHWFAVHIPWSRELVIEVYHLACKSRGWCRWRVQRYGDCRHNDRLSRFIGKKVSRRSVSKCTVQLTNTSDKDLNVQ
jgi:hypothetical protein